MGVLMCPYTGDFWGRKNLVRYPCFAVALLADQIFSVECGVIHPAY